MSSKEKFYEIVLAALLHDIGKFKQRADLLEDKGKSHPDIGYSWLVSHYDEGVVASGARNHHGNEPETWQSNSSLIFFEADNCAAAERKTEFDPCEGQWHRKIQLANAFSRVKNPHIDEPNTVNTEQYPKQSYWPLTSLGGWISPIEDENENSPQEYEKLWSSFEKEFLRIKANGNHKNIDVILNLLQKYTSFIPSITLKIYGGTDASTYKKHPDVSLFDHLKISGATATCLYHYHRHEKKWDSEILKEEITGKDTWNDNHKPFLLVGGDISGVQKFIYTISSKGALKMLKGRSFFLELLTEQTVDRLLGEIELTRCNVIFTGGGRFYLIAPNIEGALKAIEGIKKEINDYLFEAFGGSLQIFIEAIPFNKANFKDASKKWSELSFLLEKSKKYKWKDRLNKFFSNPAMPHKDCLTQNCQICGREDKPLVSLSKDKPDIMSCEYCRDQYLLGHLLQDSSRRGENPVIYRWQEKPETDRYIRIGDFFYQPTAGTFGTEKEQISVKANAVYHLNDWDLTHYTHPKSRPLLAGNYLPEDEECQDLNGMAQNGFGIEKLGVLRMDVDHLGRIFSYSIPEGERTLSRMASLSRQLSLFFKYFLNGILNNTSGFPSSFRVIDRKEPRKLSIVYSGGDDLFLIGQWLDITEAAYDIKKAFSQFTLNPNITISAGISIGDKHDPVYRLAESANQAEKSAKENTRKSITLFDTHTFEWEEAESMMKCPMKTITELFTPYHNHISLSTCSISNGVLYRFLAITRDNRREKVWILPKLAYVFGRFKPEDKYAETWSDLKEYVFSNRVNWHYLETSLLWSFMMMRKGGER